MFEALQMAPPDAILGLTEAFKNDPEMMAAMKEKGIDFSEVLNFYANAKEGAKETTEANGLATFISNVKTLSGDSKSGFINLLAFGSNAFKGIINGKKATSIKAADKLAMKATQEWMKKQGLTKEQMSVPSRTMAIADIFEALSAADRPYKQAKPVSECLTIMGRLVNNQHLDGDLFTIFVREKVYEDYINKFANPEQLDEFDVESIPGLQGYN